MKQFISILIITIIVNILCVWDLCFTQDVFKYMKSESEEIYEAVLTTPITDEKVSAKILELKDYWTDKMNVLVISISRKDLQPISDQLNFLDSAITNNDQESAITYALHLKYNLEGLHETVGFSLANLL